MDSSSHTQIVLSKINEFHRLTMSDSDIKIKNAILEILHLWPEVLAAIDQATDDELFTLNISRAVLTQVFTIVLSKDFFNKDYLLVREIFFTCFNILINHTYIFTITNSTSQTTFIDSNIRLLMKILTSITSLVKFQYDDFSKINDQQLFIAMRKHIDQDSKHDNLTDGIISLIWNLTDRTILVPLFLNTGYANSVIEWIKNREIKFRDDKLNAPIHILHNLSRHDDGIKELNIYNALQIINNINIEPNKYDDSDDMTIHIAMIRALLTDINQIKIDSTSYSNQILNMIIQLCIDAAKNERYRYNGSHISEPLTVLVKLFYNDEILHNTFCNNETKSSSSSSNIQSLLELLVSLLIKFYPKINFDNDILENYTCVVILNLFWLISNHEQYRQIIRNFEQLMSIIKSVLNDEEIFIDTFMPRTMKSIKQSANDILKNLNS
ncbi:unnamed protein product [Rotaria sp. Silwood1]|nr:unnamed protein product [Rotaria sp. Silwood1]CAF1632741.1 unnamed protein product [Rotaria sp. Silwood1]CAF3805055.1 unnamed protein product [Rotaria sp. Silwood1]CAF3867986.1 unnamed protein product [Rotaria sp. Silwood1]CAF4745625.1 unnamed protein product [Rotaria sp. Silwood1]